VRADGSGATHITDGTEPNWSPDGKRIAYVGSANDPSDLDTAFWHIHTVAPDGSGDAQISPERTSDREPSWSPNGRRIVFSVEYGDFSNAPSPGIWVMDADGSHRRQLTHNGAREDQAPSFSPNGRKIVFADFGIAIMRADGSHRRQLIEDDAAYKPAWQPLP